MSDSNSDIIIAHAAFIILSQTLKKKRRKGRWLVTNLMQRIVDNVDETMRDMQEQEESGQFHNFCRMASEDFDHLLSLMSDKIRKSSTNFRDSIPPYDRLAVTKIFGNWRFL